ncbi:hypothetical protein KEH51_13730 [[Brevibacterium] frigoritolerans]|uniref:Uncharacterized protein n=1 Tax=Peribacillus frigoritolerans TaxID=450367 RepID=A0A941FHS2_9BACI|nr:hypothetical protein [Peribacillus frigoritolerans]
MKISDEELDRELKMMKTMYGTAGQNLNKSNDQLRQEIQSSLLLEKLTKDVSVSKTAMRNYYDNNKDIYRIPTAFHISHITTSTKSRQTKSYVNWRKVSPLKSWRWKNPLMNLLPIKGRHGLYITG